MKRPEDLKWKFIAVIVFSIFSIYNPSSAVTEYDLSKDKVAYIIGGSHLDDQWRWTYKRTIDTLIPLTFRENFRNFEAYPDFKFSWAGAFRYRVVKQKYPKLYDSLKTYIAKGNWNVAGGMVTQPDVHLPSPESLIRHFLYGNGFFEDEFGKTSIDIYLPDNFGFSYALPTVGVHCGIKGFSTCRFGWHSVWEYPWPTPFPLGRWRGVDGSDLVVVGRMGPWYNNRNASGIDKIVDSYKYGDDAFDDTGLWAIWAFYGMGDEGGGLTLEDMKSLHDKIEETKNSTVKWVNTSSDQIFKDLTDQQISRFPVYQGEITSLLETASNTSRAGVKLRNRLNEQRGVAAEHAAVMAKYLAGSPYPSNKIWEAWWRVLAHQFHDDITGVSIKDVYDLYTYPRLDSSLREFTEVMNEASNTVASKMNTLMAEIDRLPVVVSNPLSFAREDVVEKAVYFGMAAPLGVKVFGPDGVEVPAQLKDPVGGIATVVFLAKVPPAGYAVYQVKPMNLPNQPDPALSITTNVLENDFYKVTVDANGDISSILDKINSKELLSAPCRLEGQAFPPNDPDGDWRIYPGPYRYPYETMITDPVWYVDQSVQKNIVENGPARVSLEIVRKQGSSTFKSYIRLAAKGAGARVSVDNHVDWQSMDYFLSVSFPMAVSDDSATYDLGLGTIKRPNSIRDIQTQGDKNYYEYTAQQWADITDKSGAYGISILTDCKYGWHKKTDNSLHLSLINGYEGQVHEKKPPRPEHTYDGDVGDHHVFNYSIFGHAGDWTNGTVQQAAEVNQPLVAHQTTAHAGAFPNSVSFLALNTDQMITMAVKKAEKSNNYVIRVRETKGQPLANAKITFSSNIQTASEILGTEKPKLGGAVQVLGNEMSFSMRPYEPKSFLVSLAQPTRINPEYRYNENTGPTHRALIIHSLFNDSRSRIMVPRNESVTRIAVIDRLGKTVRVIYRSNDGTPGLANISWNKCDNNGRCVSAGVYFVEVKTKHGRYCAPMTVF